MSKQRLLGFLAIALCVGCGDDTSSGDSNAADEPGASGAECPSDSPPTYDDFAADFLDSYCVRCHSSELEGSARHGAPMGLDYETLANVMAVPADQLDWMAAAGPAQSNQFMPPSEPRPSQEERELFGQWLACDRP